MVSEGVFLGAPKPIQKLASNPDVLDRGRSQRLSLRSTDLNSIDLPVRRINSFTRTSPAEATVVSNCVALLSLENAITPP
jgi:hypothetical protein